MKTEKWLTLDQVLHFIELFIKKALCKSFLTDVKKMDSRDQCFYKQLGF